MVKKKKGKKTQIEKEAVEYVDNLFELVKLQGVLLNQLKKDLLAMEKLRRG